MDYQLGVYELHVQYAIANALAPGYVFYDIGANRGYMTMLGARCVGPSGHVFAFEPLPENLASLREVISDAHCQCTAVAAAVTSHTGTAIFTRSSHHTEGSLATDKPGDRIAVDAVRLDDFVLEQPLPDLVKVDVEGAEAQVLEGATNLLASPKPIQWLIEIHSPACEKNVAAILLRHGYASEPVAPFVKLARSYPQHVVAYKLR